MILLNSHVVSVNHFPNAETSLGEQLKAFTTSQNETQHLTLRFETNEDILNTFFIKKWLDEEGFSSTHLHVPYLPYSRMDRKVGGHLYTLKYLSDLINSLSFEKVFVLEAHSHKTEELLENVSCISYTKELLNHAMDMIQFNKDEDVIIFPDKGAKERYHNLLESDIDTLQGEKTRDFNTGDILGIHFEKDPEKEYKRSIIVDDLCSRGGTFIQISELCSKFGINENFLAVTHLESNVYTGSLFDVVSRVFTTDAMQPFLSETLEKFSDQLDVLSLPTQLYLTQKEEY